MLHAMLYNKDYSTNSILAQQATLLLLPYIILLLPQHYIFAISDINHVHPIVECVQWLINSLSAITFTRRKSIITNNTGILFSLQTNYTFTSPFFFLTIFTLFTR